MAFIVKYPENNGRSDGANPWSNRQTGVYQSFDSKTQTTLWILLNPKPQSAADSRIKDIFSAGADGLLHLQEQRPLVGLIVLSSYILNWRTYMAFYEKEELRMVRLCSFDCVARLKSNFVSSLGLYLALSSTTSFNLATPPSPSFETLKHVCYHCQLYSTP